MLYCYDISLENFTESTFLQASFKRPVGEYGTPDVNHQFHSISSISKWNPNTWPWLRQLGPEIRPGEFRRDGGAFEYSKGALEYYSDALKSVLNLLKTMLTRGDSGMIVAQNHF